MGAVRTSKMVDARWPGPESSANLVPICHPLTEFSIFEDGCLVRHVIRQDKKSPSTGRRTGAKGEAASGRAASNGKHCYSALFLVRRSQSFMSFILVRRARVKDLHASP